MASLRIVTTDGTSDTLAHASTIAEPRSVRPENAYTVEPGTLIADKYRVVRTLGRGGMGLVVEAFHLDLQVPVAIKLLLPELMEYSEAASRFQREARAVTKLGSQHVARVLDVDALPSGEPFIVMEYLKGRDLAQRVRDAIPLSVGEAIDCTVQACDAIAEAHSLGIVHRDIKPANLFVAERPGGETIVKVLDFGVSKVLTGDTGEVSITRTTTILGSALYMSPEQMRSAKSVDARTDIYALGACLYEMLARRPPYLAGSFPELCAAVYSGPPMSITEWSPDVPDGLAKVIDKALAHEPDARYADVAELVHALAPYAQEDTRTRIETILRRYAPHLALPPPARRRRSLEPVLKSDPEDAEPGRRSGARWIVAAVIALGLAGSAVAFRSRIPWAALRGATPATSVEAAPNSGSAANNAAANNAAANNAAANSASASGEPANSAPASSAAANNAAANSTAPATSASASSTAANNAAANSTAPATTASVNSTAPATTASAKSAVSATTAAASASAKPSASVTASPGKTAVAPPTTPVAPKQEPPSDLAPPATPKPPATTNNDLVDKTCYAIQPDGTQKVVPCN